MIHNRPTTLPDARGKDIRTLRALAPFLWTYRGRVLLALGFLVLAKIANVGIPLVLKDIVDRLDTGTHATLALPLSMLLMYGALKLASSLFTEMRDSVFARVRHGAMRSVSLKVLEHLHKLSLRYHLDRRTGAVTREIDQGIRGISSLISFTLYSILPTLIEISLVVGYLVWHYEVWFAAIVGVSLLIYVGFTVAVTNWRTTLRRRWNELESKAQSRAVDSLLNFETVKYFGNEDYEARRYDETLATFVPEASPMPIFAAGAANARFGLATALADGHAAAGAALAGALWANSARFVSPDMMSWQKSGELMVMVILGGIGTLYGPIVGAAALLATAWRTHRL